MKLFRRGVAAAAMLCALNGAARADSADYPAVSNSDWTQVGTAGVPFRIQAIGNPVIVSTSTAKPTTDAGPILFPGLSPDCMTPTQNVWVKAAANTPGAYVKTQTGVTCPGTAAAGGAQDGTDATGVTPPAGATGIRGWLSGIYQAVTGVLKVTTSPSAGTLSDAALTQQSLSGLSLIGQRAAEPGSLGEWGVQSQAANTMYLVGYAADGTTRLWTLAIGPGAGQGKQGGDESYLQNVGPFTGPLKLWGTSGDQAMLTRQ